MGFASDLILELVKTGIQSSTQIYSGVAQTKALESGEAKAEKQYLGDLAQRRSEIATQTKLTKDQMRENRRQFDLSYGLQKEQIGVVKNEYGRNVFRDQVTNLTGILDKNESLKNLYINRLKSLRN